MVSTSLGRLAERRLREETRNRWQGDFHRLWAAQTVALFGTEITVLSLPLMAALLLGATPLQMGLLVAAGEAPFLLCSLFFGVLADRVRRRPLLVAADVGRALLLAAVPVAAVAGVLRIELLYVVAFLAGVLSVLFEVAHYAYVPALVPGTNLTAANGKLQVSYSAAAAIGPGLAGLLIQWVTAPFAVIGTAVSFLVSASLLGSIPRPEASPGDGRPQRGLRAEIGEGLRALLGHPLLRPIVAASAAIGLFLYAVRALYVLFATRELGLDAVQIGLVLAVGGIAAVPGGLLAARVAATVGFGTAIWGGWLVSGAALLLIPLATAQTAIPVLIAAQAIAGLAETICRRGSPPATAFWSTERSPSARSSAPPWPRPRICAPRSSSALLGPPSARCCCLPRR
jgi:MFS family permease